MKLLLTRLKIKVRSDNIEPVSNCSLLSKIDHVGGRTIKIKKMTAFRWFSILLITCLLIGLSGCAKKTVIFIPQEERGQVHKKNDVEILEERTKILKDYLTSWLGTRYVYGGISRNGVDCSGLTLVTYKELFGRKLPRTVREQVKKGAAVDKDLLQPGDLVFFKINVFQKHVGIFLENDLFVHASLSSGVMISRLNDSYWKQRYWQAKRIQENNAYGEEIASSESYLQSL
ncbi:MAG: NlpC/P60 family protein [Desulforhopalus sp.]